MIALITGVAGQGGSCLAERSLHKGYEVPGIKLRSSLFNTGRIGHLYRDLDVTSRTFILRDDDMTDSTSSVRFIQAVLHDEIYGLAAQNRVLGIGTGDG